MRDGRIRGQRGWVVEKVEDVTDAELVEHLLQQIYGVAEAGGRLTAARARRRCPREVLVPVLPPDVEQVQAWLTGLRGSKVVGARSRSAGTSASSPRPCTATPSTRWCCTARAARAT